jgi:hypothetical protein
MGGRRHQRETGPLSEVAEMCTTRHAWAAIVCWMVCISPAPLVLAADPDDQFFGPNLTGQWQVEGELLRESGHRVLYAYDELRDEDYDEAMAIHFGDGEPPVSVVQHGRKVEGIGARNVPCGDYPQVLFVGTVSEDNRVELTVRIPGIEEWCYQDQTLHFVQTDWVGSFNGTYDPAQRVITGTFTANQERDYLEGWQPDGSYWFEDETNVIQTGTFAITIQAPELNIVDAHMVSPDELGIWIRVKFPEDTPKESLKKVKLWATINGKDVERVFDVTSDVKPGEWWPAPDVQNDMFDLRDHKLLPTTRFRIDLRDANGDGICSDSVPRFTKNQKFVLSGVAYCEGTPQSGSFASPESTKEVEIPLPVVVLHGYIHKFGLKQYVGYPIPVPFLGAFISYEGAYKGFHEFLEGNGYQPEREWDGSYEADLVRHGYSTKKYKTLWDPHDFRGSMYTNPWMARPNDMENDVGKLLSKQRDQDGQFVGEVWNYCYADKVNFVGHSFGGLVARYYASKHPDEVNEIITAGTPHLGVTFFYVMAFSRTSKKAFEDEFTRYADNCALRWVIPTYRCTYLKREGGEIEPFDPKIASGLFTNTFEGAPANFSVFCGRSEIGTDGKEVLRYETQEDIVLTEKDNGWYKTENITLGPGDGYILADSARASGLSIGPFVGEKHARLLADPAIQNNILALLQYDLWDDKPFEVGSVHCVKGRLGPSATASHAVVIEGGGSQARFEASWTGSDLDLTLRDADGREIDPATCAADPNVTFLEGANYEQYSIRNPVPGTWTMEVSAVDVPEDGEEYIAVAQLLTDQPPFADLDDDGEVNLDDLAVLGTHWRSQDCLELDLCSGADLDGNGIVDSIDLSILAEYWLVQTP